MKYPLVILITTVLLPTFVFLMLTTFVLTEFELLLDRKKESEC
jgi:hypothetical protein